MMATKKRNRTFIWHMSTRKNMQPNNKSSEWKREAHERRRERRFIGLFLMIIEENEREKEKREE
jgi:hypothetical protein